MLAALRDFSLDSAVISRGDLIPLDIQDRLPQGRVESLKAQRYVREITSESELSKQVAQLTERVEKLEARLPRRGRPPKELS